MRAKPTIVCLDMEGVLTPEIWISVAEKTGIAALRRTTRDEPDYDVLMRGRLQILSEHNLTLQAIQEVIRGLEPLPGARAFLDELRTRTQVIILSDTFYQFAQPLMEKLGWPSLFCHQLEIDGRGMVVNYHLRIPDQKRASVQALQRLQFQVVAAGDSYNDLSMLRAADHGILFCPPPQIAAENADLPVSRDYAQLLRCIQERF